MRFFKASNAKTFNVLDHVSFPQALFSIFFFCRMFFCLFLHIIIVSPSNEIKWSANGDIYSALSIYYRVDLSSVSNCAQIAKIQKSCINILNMNKFLIRFSKEQMLSAAMLQFLCQNKSLMV